MGVGGVCGWVGYIGAGWVWGDIGGGRVGVRGVWGRLYLRGRLGVGGVWAGQRDAGSCGAAAARLGGDPALALRRAPPVRAASASGTAPHPPPPPQPPPLRWVGRARTTPETKEMAFLREDEAAAAATPEARGGGCGCVSRTYGQVLRQGPGPAVLASARLGGVRLGKRPRRSILQELAALGRLSMRPLVQRGLDSLSGNTGQSGGYSSLFFCLDPMPKLS